MNQFALQSFVPWEESLESCNQQGQYSLNDLMARNITKLLIQPASTVIGITPTTDCHNLRISASEAAMQTLNG